MIQKILAHPEPLTGVDISFDSTLICTAAYDGYVRLWDLHKATCVKTLTSETGGTSAVSCLCLLGETLLIGNMNSQLGLYDLQGTLKKTYSGHVNKDFCLDV